MNLLARSVIGIILAVSWTASVCAEEPLGPLSPPSSTRTRFEARAGGFLHAVDNAEKNSYDLNLEAVLPRPDWLALDGGWDLFVPRAHAGAMLNFSHQTSYLYAGGLWTVDLTEKFFAETFLGGALHNGSLDGDFNGVVIQRSVLGCRWLFHSGGSVGYRLDPQWSLMVTFDHLSNGNAVLHACPGNQGLNEYGLRVGFGF